MKGPNGLARGGGGHDGSEWFGAEGSRAASPGHGVRAFYACSCIHILRRARRAPKLCRDALTVTVFLDGITQSVLPGGPTGACRRDGGSIQPPPAFAGKDQPCWLDTPIR